MAIGEVADHRLSSVITRLKDNQIRLMSVLSEYDEHVNVTFSFITDMIDALEALRDD